MRHLPLLLAALLVSCEAPLTVTDAPGPHSEAAGKIFGGSAPDAPEHAAVVGLHEVYGAGSVVSWPFCTGTLIRGDVVLTAAHCLVGGGGGEMDPDDVRIYVGDDPAVDLLAHDYEVIELDAHDDYSLATWFNDIGVLRLATDAAAAEGVDPVPELPADEGFTEDDIETIMNLAGFGYTESWDYGTKLQVDVELAGFGCAPRGCAGADDEDTQVSYDQSDGAGVCTGDSGGPLFVTRGAQVYVGGTTSFTDYWCEQYGVSTRVDAFEDWILDFAGESGGFPGGGGPGGGFPGGGGGGFPGGGGPGGGGFPGGGFPGG